MNVIEYIRKQNNASELFNKTFSAELNTVHFDDPSWEASSNYFIMNKNKVQNIETALMISVIQIYVRYEVYYFKETPKIEIYNNTLEALNYHYGNANFEIIENIKLEDYLDRNFNKTDQKIYGNYNWKNPVSVDKIKEQDWTKEKSFKGYHLKSEWNDEDYLFETNNYYIRYNWGTAA